MLISRRRITIAIAVVGLVGAVAFGLGLRTRSQQLQPSASNRNNDESQIEKLPDQALRVLENNDSPLRILEARVKEIPGPQFLKLTGKKTDLPAVCSVPEVKLLNGSVKTITGFILAVRDPESKTTRGVILSKIKIVPGATFTAVRESFLRPEWVSTSDKDGQENPHMAQPTINSEKYWLSASRATLFVTVVQVKFEDGSEWVVKEGGDIK
jgi:hypothetical protein